MEQTVSDLMIVVMLIIMGVIVSLIVRFTPIWKTMKHDAVAGILIWIGIFHILMFWSVVILSMITAAASLPVSGTVSTAKTPGILQVTMGASDLQPAIGAAELHRQ